VSAWATSGIDLLRERGLTIAVGEVSTWGMISSWIERADVEGDIFRGGWVLSRRHRWTLGRDDVLSKSAKQEGLRLVHTICNVSGADVGLVVVNLSNDDTYLGVVWGDEIRERSMPFRGYEAHSQAWVASLALDMVRRMLLGLPHQA